MRTYPADVAETLRALISAARSTQPRIDALRAACPDAKLTEPFAARARKNRDVLMRTARALARCYFAQIKEPRT